MPEVKIVFGEIATKKHLEGKSDEIVEDYGTIITKVFDTDDELDAYLSGVADMNGWEDYCFYEDEEIERKREAIISHWFDICMQDRDFLNNVLTARIMCLDVEEIERVYAEWGNKK